MNRAVALWKLHRVSVRLRRVDRRLVRLDRWLRQGPGRSWRAGLIHIWCWSCGRDLDWAQPEFLARHAAPRCAACARRLPNPSAELAEPAVVRGVAEVEVLRATPIELDEGVA